MRTTTLPPAIYPHPLSHDGVTYHVATYGDGLRVYSFPDGRMEERVLLLKDPDVKEKGNGLLTWVEDIGLLVAYQRGAEVLVRAIPSGALLESAECIGNFPHVWNGNELAVQHKTDLMTWVGRYPFMDMKPVNAAVTMGLSRILSGVPIYTDDDNRNFRATHGNYPRWTPDGASCGEHDGGGVRFKAFGKDGVLLYGKITNNPTITRQADGRYTVAAWQQTSSGSGDQWLIMDVEEKDVVWPETPLFKPEPYTVPKLIGVIYGSSSNPDYGYGEFGGNAETLFPGDDWQQMKVKKSVIAAVGALNVPKDKLIGTWHDTGHSTFPLNGPRPHFVYDERTGSDHVGIGDVLEIQAYPFYGEAPELFEQRMNKALDKYKDRRKIIVAKFYPGNPPHSFTEEQLMPYFPIYDRLIQRPDVDGMLAFEGMRSGLKKFPKWRQVYENFAEVAGEELPDFSVEPEPEPEEPEMAEVFVLLTKLETTDQKIPKADLLSPLVSATRCNEIVQDGKHFLEKSDDGEKTVCVNPQGGLEDRPKGTRGSWEELRKTAKGNYAAVRGGKIVGVIVAV